MSGKVETLQVLVTGATGNQGNATARALLKNGHRVRALVLDAEEPQAKALSALGAEITEGNFDDTASLDVACAGVDSIFLMSTFYETQDPAKEVTQATAVIAAAEKAGVGHLIYSSVANLASAWEIPHFQSKGKVEQRIAEMAIPSTVIGPTFFMDNFLGPAFQPRIAEGVLCMPIPAKSKVAYTSTDNIGAMAAAVIERREAVFGGRYPIAGDELTGDQVAAVLSEVTGRKVRYVPLTLDEFAQAARNAGVARMNAGVARMFEWIGTEGFGVDIPELHRAFPEVSWDGFGDWARRQHWL